MDDITLAMYWNDIPVGRENAVTYDELITLWGINERRTRAILHDLSALDNGDNYILIRSGSAKGFYRTDDINEITKYKTECLHKGRSVFAPIKKINRVLNSNTMQYNIENNIRLYREARGLTQKQVCNEMKKHDKYFDKSLLSKMENGVCLPTCYQLSKLAVIFDCEPSEIVNADLYY